MRVFSQGGRLTCRLFETIREFVYKFSYPMGEFTAGSPEMLPRLPWQPVDR